MFEKNFPEIYSITKRELAAKLENETIHDRIFGNWVIPLATFRTLETVIDVPFSYAELFETAVKGIRNQNELAQESSEIADFWSMLQGFQTSGKCIEKAHYRIRYMKSFRPLSIKEDIELQVVGKNMEKIKDEVNSNKVNIIGSVDDLSAYYKESDFVIEPIFQGAGMKVKTAEAMMFGKVILGTEEALEGYKNEINNRKLMVFECNTADEFSKTINDIYDGKIKIEKFNKDIRENYIENYSQESAKKMLENILFNKKEK